MSRHLEKRLTFREQTTVMQWIIRLKLISMAIFMNTRVIKSFYDVHDFALMSIL